MVKNLYFTKTQIWTKVKHWQEILNFHDFVGKYDFLLETIFVTAIPNELKNSSNFDAFKIKIIAVRENTKNNVLSINFDIKLKLFYGAFFGII